VWRILFVAKRRMKGSARLRVEPGILGIGIALNEVR